MSVSGYGGVFGIPPSIANSYPDSAGAAQVGVIRRNALTNAGGRLPVQAMASVHMYGMGGEGNKDIINREQLERPRIPILTGGIQNDPLKRHTNLRKGTNRIGMTELMSAMADTQVRKEDALTTGIMDPYQHHPVVRRKERNVPAFMAFRLLGEETPIDVQREEMSMGMKMGENHIRHGRAGVGPHSVLESKHMRPSAFGRETQNRLRLLREAKNAPVYNRADTHLVSSVAARQINPHSLGGIELPLEPPQLGPVTNPSYRSHRAYRQRRARV